MKKTFELPNLKKKGSFFYSFFAEKVTKHVQYTSAILQIPSQAYNLKGTIHFPITHDIVFAKSPRTSIIPCQFHE